MNNIEILEEFIKHYKEVQEKYKDDEIQAEIERSCYFEEVPAQAIENLIQENKELKEENNNLKEQLKDMEKEFIEVCEKSRNSIPKSKIKKRIEELQQTCKDCHFRGSICKDFKTFNQCTIQVTIKNLQELLEEGE